MKMNTYWWITVLDCGASRRRALLAMCCVLLVVLMLLGIVGGSISVVEKFIS